MTCYHLQQSLRLVNISKFEVRLSLRPPARPELDVWLCGARGLALTAGAATELRVLFRPSSVRAVRDELTVRVSAGGQFRVPIACYMQPPVLNSKTNSLPLFNDGNISSGIFFFISWSCVVLVMGPVLSEPGPAVEAQMRAVRIGGAGRAGGASAGRAGDVVDLGARLLGAVHYAPLLLCCAAPHASFCLLPEDSWLAYSLDVSLNHFKSRIYQH